MQAVPEAGGDLALRATLLQEPGRCCVDSPDTAGHPPSSAPARAGTCPLL